MIVLIASISGKYHATKSIIVVNSTDKLSKLADEICYELSDVEEELNDDSHMYGFSDNLHNFFGRPKSGFVYIKNNEDIDHREEKNCDEINV